MEEDEELLEFGIGFYKDARVRLNEQKTREQLQRLLLQMRRQYPAWTIELAYEHEPAQTETGLRFSARLLFSKDSDDEGLLETVHTSAIAVAHQVAPTCEYWQCDELMGDLPGFNFEGWELPELTDEVLEKYFGHIYDREPHIRIIYDSLKLAARTDFRVRHHILLRGRPACAKTILFLAFRDWLGPHMFLSLSAATMTKAGLEKQLMEHAMHRTLPPILLCEEVEKTSPENLNCLLQVMDVRAEIQKTNWFVGNQVASAPVLVWGTCNDEALLRRFADGAVWSRFNIKPKCDRPSKTLMEKILLDECKLIEGNPEWVNSIVRFLYEEVDGRLEDYDDPRLAKSLLIGGDRLLDGTFFSDYRMVNGL